jgi:hypothetical protein
MRSLVTGMGSVVTGCSLAATEKKSRRPAIKYPMMSWRALAARPNSVEAG